MRRTTLSIIIAVLLLALIPIAHAFTFTDDLNADFTLGDTTQVNVTNDTVILNSSSNTTYYLGGTYTSRVFDLGSNPTTVISWNATTDANTTILISTRSGPNNLPPGSWSSWSSAYASSGGSLVTSTSQRYLQYRAQLGTTTNTSTPTLDYVILNGTNAGTLVTYNALTTNLTTADTLPWPAFVTVTDTLPITSVQGRWLLLNSSQNGTNLSSASWSPIFNLTSISSTVYNISVPIPSGGWASARYATAYVDIIANTTNGSVNYTKNVTLSEYVDFWNNAPVLDPITDKNATQNTTISFTVTGSDIDGQSLTFSINNSNMTVTPLTNTSAQINWTPGPSDISIIPLKVTMTDSMVNVTRSFTINVTEINYPPAIVSVPTITGYYGIRQLIQVVATDPNTYQNLTFSMVPPFFTLVPSTVNGLSNGSNATAGTWYGQANITPVDPEIGVNNITWFVTDGNITINSTSTMSITYCGDGVCQASYETADTCRKDCFVDKRLDGIGIVFPDRSCVNTTMNFQTFNASDRSSCYYQGRVQSGLAFCAPLEGVSVAVYSVKGSLLTSVGSVSSGTNGTGAFLPLTAGEYKFYATKDGYSNTSARVLVRNCNADIVIRQENITIAQPPGPPVVDKPHLPPSEEEPALTQPQISWVSVFLFYFLTPLLLASMLYFSSVFYDVNKDTLPWLLETRIWVYTQRVKMKPYVDKTAKAISPVTQPLGALYSATLKPVFAHLTDMIKKRNKKP